MKRLSTFCIAVLLAVLAACSGDDAPPETKFIKQDKPLTFNKPTPQVGDQNATVSGSIPGTVPDNIVAPPPGVTKETCADSKKSGKPMPKGCESIAVAEAAAAVTNALQNVGAAVQNAVSGIKMPKMPSWSGFSWGSGSSATPAATPVPFVCDANKNGDVVDDIPDVNLRAVVKTAFDDNKLGDYSATAANEIFSVLAINKGITSLSGLECLPNLHSLNVKGNPIESLGVILKNLMKLDISGTKITDLSQVPTNTPKLEELDASGLKELVTIKPLLPPTNSTAPQPQTLSRVDLDGDTSVPCGEVAALKQSRPIGGSEQLEYTKVTAYYCVATCLPGAIRVEVAGTPFKPIKQGDGSWLYMVSGGSNVLTLDQAGEAKLILDGDAGQYTINKLSSVPNSSSSFETILAQPKDGKIVWPSYSTITDSKKYDPASPASAYFEPNTNIQDSISFELQLPKLACGEMQPIPITIKRYVDYPPPATELLAALKNVSLYIQFDDWDSKTQFMAQLMGGGKVVSQTSDQYAANVINASYPLTIQPAAAVEATIADITAVRLYMKDPDGLSYLDYNWTGLGLHSTYWEAVPGNPAKKGELSGKTGYVDVPITWKPRAKVNVPGFL